MKFNPNSEQNAGRGPRTPAGLLLLGHLNAGRGLRVSVGLLPHKEYMSACRDLRVSVGLYTLRVMNTCHIAGLYAETIR